MIRYLNSKTVYGIETVDSLDSKDFKTFREFRTEINRLASKYHLAGIKVYISQRGSKREVVRWSLCDSK